MGWILAVYACLSAVYLLYIPHALPVLDDWTCYEQCERARAGGIGGELSLLRRVIDNSWGDIFRMYWASNVVVVVLSFAAGFAGWPYFLLAWTAHLLTAVLLQRIVWLLARDQEIGFFAGAMYVVFPAANNALFWPGTNCIYYLQALGFFWWFYLTWKKLAVAKDYRYRWKDLALLLLVVFSGEQILPALVLLMPVAFWLFGERQNHRAFFRFWLTHATMVAILVISYALLINRNPIFRSFGMRYGASGRWNPRPVVLMLLGSLGLAPQTAGWRPAWGLDGMLIAILGLAAIALFWGWRRCSHFSRTSVRQGTLKILLWSVAGAVLTYLPLARLNTFEWRYLYVLSVFLVPAGAALLGLMKRPARVVLVLLAVAYGVSVTYFEMRQCWVPQSRAARAMLDTVAGAGPFLARDVLIFSGDPVANGPAPSFINGASWSLNSMLQHYSRSAQIQGARDLAMNERGELALYRPGSFVPWFHKEELHRRLRVFVYDPSNNRFAPKSLLAFPAAEGRYQLFALRTFQAAGPFPERALTREELQGLPYSNQIYFVHRIPGRRHWQAAGS
ncbi:MAG: hypothetical protein HY236_01105 [Acidobacteria bacterium]|nr:hypothetical protein [Acidobacteriota bacterium]